ncbi:rhoptry protein ROP6 [Toxoplasma gondii ME49]|uniref:Rhoptry protein 6 n=3 Tax=Toxoplasma gondii TaxID=5811 RepID=B6KB96_TOXGV|nr:rhoptry protein ROP6 [Toxoplasma gondii ME49]EPT29365.1 rhoptry protein ROP6 [Toxoplasma gondii ME49]ESS32219.1 rhoptry protein ROP6 [Toxoplasma gondii VEG]KYF41717.1 rhoptry protein ROP6 [Toxoplasma gondii ARI]CEL74460.1 TPA: rhoptry protein 6 [Toxoplasma gondii VEG]|eukprot:XP_002365080.1 rhoptry protein ROP6 [Toxoplasma gondii ME49]
MRSSVGQSRLPLKFFLAPFSVKNSVFALFFVFALVCVSGLSWEDAEDGAAWDSVSNDSDDSFAKGSDFGEVKLGSAGQRQLLSQLQNELGGEFEDADVSMLQRDHGIHGEEAGLFRKAVPGLDDPAEDDEADGESASDEAEADSDVLADDEEGTSLIENASEEDTDNSEADSQQEDDSVGEDSFLQQEGEDSEEERAVEDPYAAAEPSYLEEDNTVDDSAAEDYAPASFVQIGSGERKIRAHMHLDSRQVAPERFAHAFNQDHVRLLDQTAVEDELLDEAAPGGGASAVVSPIDENPAEMESTISEGEAGSAVAAPEQGIQPEAEFATASEEPRPLEPVDPEMAAQQPQLPQEAMPTENADLLGNQPRMRNALEPSAKVLEPETLEGSPALVPPAETEEGTAAQIAEEMSKQDQGMQEARPQEVLTRHTWQDMERTEDLRKNDVPAAVANSGSQIITAASSVALAGLLVAGQLLFSVGMY